MLNGIKNWLRELNEKRLWRRKIAKLTRMADECSADTQLVDNRNVTIPCSIKSILLVDTLHCYGDSLYVNGLIRKLRADSPSVSITVLAEQQQFPIYQARGCRMLDRRDPETIELLADECFDLVIDLCYTDDGEWFFRKKFLGSKERFVITLSPVVHKAKIFSAFINLTSVTLFGERMYLVAKAVSALIKGEAKVDGKKQLIFTFAKGEIVKPWIDILSDAVNYEGNNFIYVNTVGSKTGREFSKEQIKTFVDIFEKQEKFIGLFYFKICPDWFVESDRVRLVRTKQFIDAVKVISNCSGVITPDTSIVHVAIAMNKPLFAIYACGKKEYPSGLDHYEVWRPVNTNSTILKKPAMRVGCINSLEVKNNVMKFLASI